MRKLFAHAVLAALLACFAAPALADGRGNAGANAAAAPVQAGPISAATAPAGQSGQIVLQDGLLTLNVPEGYRFYAAEIALDYMQRNSASSPGGAVLGLIAPASARIDQPGTWAVVVSYDSIGYVQGETAGGLTDANFETEVRAARDAQGRPFEGFAVLPAFDAGAPRLAWAERTAAPGAGGRDFRHEQKLLGRQGVACLSAIGSADQMGAILDAAPDLMAMLSFQEGRRHADFQAASDQVSAYSVPGLITGVATSAEAVTADAGDNTQTGFGGLSGLFPLIAIGVVLLAGAGYVLMRRRRTDANLDPEA